MAKLLDFESIDKGMPLDGMSIPALTRVALARFAGGIDDYNPLHLDDKVAVAAGKNSVFAPGHMIMAFIGRMIEHAFAGSSLRRYGLRMLKLVWPGDVLTCRGVIIDKREESGECVVDVDVWADNQRGETVAKGRVLAVVARTPRGLSKAESNTGIVYIDAEPKPQKGGDNAPAKSKKSATKK